MRLFIVMICLWLGLFSLTVHAQLPDLKELKSYVFRVEADGCPSKPKKRALTGFKIAGISGLVTALHGVVGCDTIYVIDSKGKYKNSPYGGFKLGITLVDKDLTVLRGIEFEKGFPKADGIQLQPEISTEVLSNRQLILLSYPKVARNIRQNSFQTKIEPVSPLMNLVDIDALEAKFLSYRKSPVTSINVIDAIGSLNFGESGAPAFLVGDTDYYLVGVASGSVLLGHAWFIPINKKTFLNPSMANQEELDALKKRDVSGLRDFGRKIPRGVVGASFSGFGLFSSVWGISLRANARRLYENYQEYPNEIDFQNRFELTRAAAYSQVRSKGKWGTVLISAGLASLVYGAIQLIKELYEPPIQYNSIFRNSDNTKNRWKDRLDLSYDSGSFHLSIRIGR